jgi:hypothetical protein
VARRNSDHFGFRNSPGALRRHALTNGSRFKKLCNSYLTKSSRGADRLQESPHYFIHEKFEYKKVTGISMIIMPKNPVTRPSTIAHGMGLGLAICRVIAEKHGGQLTASSDGKSGALFQLVLPAVSTEKTARETGPTTRRLHDSDGGQHY